MNFVEKQNLILQKLQDTNYEAFAGNSDQATMFITSSLLSILDYSNAAIETNMVNAVKNENDDDAIKDNEKLLIQASHYINMLNMLCERLGIEKFMNIDIHNKQSVIDEIKKYTTELYNLGINKH